MELEYWWEQFGEDCRRLAPASEVHGYKNVFGRGFIVTTDGDSPMAPEGWRNYSLGSWKMAAAPDLEVSHHRRETERAEYEALVLGTVFGISSAGPDGVAVVRRLTSELASSQGNLDQLLNYTDQLSGRYLLLIRAGDRSWVIGDPMGSMPCFWYESGGLILASHTGLISAAQGGLESGLQSWVMNNPSYVSAGGKTLPGLITAFDNVHHVYPNCLLEVSKGEVRHRRFFPRTELVPMTVDEAYSVFFETLRGEVLRWLAVDAQPILGLTGGSDSKAVLTAGLDRFVANDAIGMTYHFFASNPVTTRDDLLKANRLALRAGLRHLMMDVKPLEAGSPMASLYQKSFPRWARFPTLAGALYENVPASSTFFVSIGGEIGTGFYQSREEPRLSPSGMASKYTYSEFRNDPRLLREFEKYYDFVEFDQSYGLGYSPYDLFYWEHRLGKWASLGYSEYDLASQPALPMNSRRFLNAMLSIPESERLGKALYLRLTDSALI